MKKLYRFIAVSLALSLSVLSSGYDVQAEDGVTSLEVVSVNHTHVGTAGQSSANGCYTTESTSTGYCTPSKGGYLGASYWNCGGCGKEVKHEGWYFGGTCPSGHSTAWQTSSSCTCTASNNSNNFPGGHYYTKTTYDLGCGKTTDTVVGTVEFKKEVTDRYLLIVDVSDGLTLVSCLWSDGSTSNTLEVTANGSYSVDVTYKEGTTEHTQHFDYLVADYDTEPPVIRGVDLPTERNTSFSVDIRATDNMGIKDYMMELIR